MKETKFRAWNTDHKVMGYTDTLTVYKDYHGPYIAGYFDYSDKTSMGYPEEGEGIITQYTGLKDKTVLRFTKGIL